MSIFPMEHFCLLILGVLIAVEKESGLLLALAIINDSASMVEWIISRKITWMVCHYYNREKKSVFFIKEMNFSSFILMSKSKKLLSYLSFKINVSFYLKISVDLFKVGICFILNTDRNSQRVFYFLESVKDNFFDWVIFTTCQQTHFLFLPKSYDASV